MEINLEINEEKGTIVDFIAKEVRYHSVCQIEYKGKAEIRSTKKPSSTWHDSGDAHSTAFNVICQFVDETIIK